MGTAIRYMSPPNFAKALRVPVHKLLGHFHPTSGESSRPLKMFISWFHRKRRENAWRIQRCYRQKFGTYAGPPGSLMRTSTIARFKEEVRETCRSGHINLRERRQRALEQEAHSPTPHPP